MKRWIVAGIVAMAGLVFADEKIVETRVIEKDGIRLEMGGEDGYSIAVDGVPFSPVSRLYVVNPGWTDRYYGYNDDKQRAADAQTTGLTPGAVGLTYGLMSGKANSIAGTQTLEILPGHRLRIATQIRMTSDTKGIIENRIASIAEPWLTNTQWSATMGDGSTTSGQTPRWAPGTEPVETTLLKGFNKVTFASPRGPLTIETSGSTSMALLDYRRNQWANGQKFYWLGILGEELPRKDTLSYEVIFTFPQQPKGKMAGPTKKITALTPVETSETVIRVPQPVDRIIPTPKQVTWEDGMLRIGTEIGVHFKPHMLLSQSFSREHFNRLEELVETYSTRLERLYGLKIVAAPAHEAGIHVTFGASSLARSDQYLQLDGYSIKVKTGEVEIADITSTGGLLNSLRTLEQLIRVDDDGNPGFRRAEVRDWPSMPFRGIHFFTGKDGRELQVKMVSEILAPLKINKLVYQVDYVKWESQPQIHSEILSMDKAEAQAVGAAAEQQGIDVIPLVNTFGHSEWLLQRPSMRYLADDPNDPYAYDPSNPEVYKITEEIYREAIAMFNPQTMHIGHDEVHLDGFPKKPENKAIGATQLFINDTMHYYNFLKKQGIRTMMWGDMLLGPGEAPDATFAPSVEEAKRRRDLLPKDIIIADWHYKSAPVEEYKSLAIFNQAGFDAIACTWNAADNIVRFAKAATDQRNETTKTLGQMQTTWAGYSFDENSLVNSLDQYVAYVLAAEAAWSGGAVDSKDVPFDYHEEFLRRWNGEMGLGKAKTGWIASLDDLANEPLSPATISLAESAFSNLDGGATELGKYGFNIPVKDGKPAVIRMGGAWDETWAPLTQLSLVFDSKTSDVPSWTQSISKPGTKLSGNPVAAKELYFAMATPFAVPDNTPVGSMTAKLDDGSTHSIVLKYGKNVMSIGDGRQTLPARVAWKSDNAEPGQGGAVLHVLRWDNPRPEEKIQSLDIKSLKTGPGLMIFGISGG